MHFRGFGTKISKNGYSAPLGWQLYLIKWPLFNLNLALWPFLEIFVPKPLKCIFHKFLYLTSQISSLYIEALCLNQNCTCFLYWISNLILLSWTKSCFFNFGWNFTIERWYKIHSEGQWQLYAATNSAFLYQSMCK